MKDKKGKEKYEYATLWLKPELKRKLKSQAALQGLSMNDYVEKLLASK